MLSFIRRQTNEVTHELAKTATFSCNFHIFDEIFACSTTLIFNKMI